MMLNEVTTQAGANKRPKRVGRGESSGHGKTCGRGSKGYQSRAGGGARPLTEGGQMPLFRRLPKRGFSNFEFRIEYAIVNIGVLSERFEKGATVDLAALQALRLIRRSATLVRVLGDGTLDKPLTVHAHSFSPKAHSAIEQAGGRVTVIPVRDSAALAKAKRNSAKGRSAKAKPTGDAT